MYIYTHAASLLMLLNNLFFQAVKIDPTFAETFRFKGIVLSAQELHDQALIAFSQANRIEKDMASYNGKSCVSVVETPFVQSCTL